MSEETEKPDGLGYCMDCQCHLSDDNAYDDTICTACYIAELEGEEGKDE